MMTHNFVNTFEINAYIKLFIFHQSVSKILRKNSASEMKDYKTLMYLIGIEYKEQNVITEYGLSTIDITSDK